MVAISNYAFRIVWSHILFDPLHLDSELWMPIDDCDMEDQIGLRELLSWAYRGFESCFGLALRQVELERQRCERCRRDNEHAGFERWRIRRRLQRYLHRLSRYTMLRSKKSVSDGS